MQAIEDVDEREIVGIALQRIGSILENDPNAQLEFSEEIDHGLKPGVVWNEKKTTSVTLEVSGVDE